MSAQVSQGTSQNLQEVRANSSKGSAQGARHKTGKQWKKGSKQPRGQQSQKQQSNNGNCGRCGHTHPDRPCPARCAECYRCHKHGHFAQMCLGGQQKQDQPRVYEVTEREVPTLFLECLSCNDTYEPAWRKKILTQAGAIDFKLDSGADVTVISEATLNRLSPKPKLRAAQTKLVSPGGPLSCRGQFVAETELKKQKFRFRVLVITGSHTDNLLSRGVAVKMGLIKRVDKVSPQDSDLFGDIGCLADALSRSPLPNQGTPDIELEIASYADAVMEMKPVSFRRLAKIAVETSQDPQLQTAMKFVRHGWPDYIKAVPPMVQDLYPVCAELSIAGDLLVRDSRIVVPQALRSRDP